MSTLPQGKIASQRLPIPPIDEQHSILMKIDAACSPVVESIDKASREIYLIREYRARLVADVVTGKVDVRGVAAELAEEFDLPKDDLVGGIKDAFVEKETGEKQEHD